MYKLNKFYIKSTKFSRIKNIIHAFSTSFSKDLTLKENRDLFLKKINISNKRLIIMNQEHTNNIIYINDANINNKLTNIDAIFCRNHNFILGVKTADCLPILFFDKKEKIIGVAHAGWKGTQRRIAQKSIKLILEKGGTIKNLVIAFGPCINTCCYNVDKKRALMFMQEFGQDKNIILERDNKYFFNLPRANYIQLIDLGIKQEQISVFPFCTFCQDKLFFSFRRSLALYDRKVNKKEYSKLITNQPKMLSVIALK